MCNKKMKILKLILSFALLSLYLQAQVPEMYMIPDIASPGMNVYVEIIGKVIDKGYFGADGIYLNDASSPLKIKFTDPADAAKVSFGPLIVSWEGRMISTQVFVNPALSSQIPSWDYNANGSNWTVNFTVVRSTGEESKGFNLYLVQPFKMGDISANGERVFGAGTLGKRSPRGAMIIDSLIMPASATYTVSTADCDGQASGNQGYLPFVLISQGPVKAGANSIINVSANASNGGIGGGGGAGRHVDQTIGAITPSDGGNGFTGGGPGGRNGGGNAKTNGGIGSGNNFLTSYGGPSLNAVVGGYSNNVVWESAGGGTGHPFGSSGLGCENGPSCEPVGGYGGGSGAKDLFAGGGGGFATNGVNGVALNGGKIVGNIFCVPIAGGSGGGGGNPKASFLSVYAGYGGGGGGSIRLSAKEFMDLQIFANGANGETSPGPYHGGSGSGGAVELYSKTSASGFVQVTGGRTNGTQTGGDGRIRLDVNNGSVIKGTTNATLFAGFTSDTTHFVQSKFTLKGKLFIDLNDPIDKINIYIKPLSKDWKALGAATRNGTDWSINIDVSNETDRIFYVVAVAEMTNSLVDNYVYKPKYILSQAAANVLSIDVAPDISSKKKVQMKAYSCDKRIYTDSLWIVNPGTDTLRFIPANFWKDLSNGFQITTPSTKLAVAPKDSVLLRFLFDYKGNMKGTYSNTFQIFPDKITDPTKNPWVVEFEMTILDMSLKYQDRITKNFLDTLKFPNSCAGRIDTLYVDVANPLSENYKIDNYKIGSFKDGKFEPVAYFTPFMFTNTIPANGTVGSQLRIIFEDVNKNGASLSSMLYIYSDKCTEPADSILVLIYVQKTQITQLNAAQNNFGNVRINDKVVRTLRFRNTGTGNADLRSVINSMNKFKILATRPPLPHLLLADSIIEVDVEYTPTTEMADLDSFRLFSAPTDTSCDVNFVAIVQGKGTKSTINYPSALQDFGKILYCFSAPSKNIPIGNDVSSPTTFSILGDDLIGPGKDAFTISNRPAKTIFNPGDVDTYVITYKPDKAAGGISLAQLAIYTDDPSSRTITINLSGELELLNVTSVPAKIFNFGNIPLGSTSPITTLSLTNNSSFKRSVINIAKPIEINVTPTTTNLAANGGNQLFDVSFTPTQEGPFSSTFQVLFGGTDCNDTLFYEVSGVGLKGDVKVTGGLDFGIINYCQIPQLTPNIENTGDAPIRIDSVYLTGADAEHFSLVNVVNGVTIQNKGENVTQNYIFDPLPPRQYRVYNAELNIDFTVNGKKQTFKQPTKAEVRTGFLALVRPIDFQNVIIGDNKTLPFTIYKDTACKWDVTIKSITPNTDQEWLSITSMIENRLLVDSLFGEMTLRPNTQGAKSLRIDFEFDMSANCVDNSYFSFIGNAAPAASIRITMPKLEAEPTEKNFQIPISALIFDGVDSVSNLTISNLQLKFDQSLFYPKSLTKGKITSYKTVGNDLVIKLEIDSISLNRNEQVITNVIGDVLLGNKELTPIVIDSVVYVQKNLVNKVEPIAGELKIIICKEGGNRLLEQTKPIQIESLQQLEKIDLNLVLPEVGDYTLELMDAKGSQLHLFKFTRNINESNEKSMSIDIREFGAGAYYLILRSPNKFATKPILIIK